MSRIGCSPRRPAGDAGRSRETQIVSETTTKSVLSASRCALTPPAKLGLPISSSSSQRKLMFTRAPRVEREPRAEERGQARALVVGRPAAVPGVALGRELERLGLPLLARAARLHVHVVVDRDGRRGGVDHAAAEHERLAVGRRAARASQPNCCSSARAASRHPAHVGLVLRIHADARDLDEVARGSPGNSSRLPCAACSSAARSAAHASRASPSCSSIPRGRLVRSRALGDGYSARDCA